MNDIRGKQVLITGAARGIGYTFARAFVDEGITLKRFRPRAQGRAFRINKRTSHITVVLATPDEASVNPSRKTQKAGK